MTEAAASLPRPSRGRLPTNDHCRQDAILMPTPDELYDAATELKEQGDLEAAVKKLYEVLEAEPGHTLSHSALAVYQQKLGQLEKAIEHALQVTTLEPNDPFSYTQLSVIYQRCGKIPEAEEAMDTARRMQMQGG